MSKITLALDSGAFSFYVRDFKQVEASHSTFNLALSRNTTDMDRYLKYVGSPTFVRYLDRYAEYLHSVVGEYEFYVSLDVIGSAEHTYDVVRYLESCGLHPMPVFHYGEDYSWLKRYVDNYEYIGIGGVGGATVTKKQFLPFGDHCFSIIKDRQGVPRVKVHGFAVTANDLLVRYPWYSVDSSTWTLQARNGTIMVPGLSSGEYVYSQGPTSIRFTERVSYMAKGYNSLGSTEKEWLGEYLDNKFGYKAEQAVEYYIRDVINASYMQELSKELTEQWRQRLDWEGPYIYLAGNTSAGSKKGGDPRTFYTALLKLGYTPRMLLSYFYPSTMDDFKTVAEDLNNE